MRKFAAIGALAALLAAFAGPAPSRAADPAPVTIVVFNAAVARRHVSRGHQAAEIRYRQRRRHHLCRTAAGCLCGGIQFRRFPGRRQRLGADPRPRRHARHQDQLSVQSVRLLGHGGDEPARHQDAGRSCRQADGRRQGHHELHDVRVAGEAAGRRPEFVPGDQHGDRRAWSATRWPIAPTRCSCGSRPIRW